MRELSAGGSIFVEDCQWEGVLDNIDNLSSTEFKV